jgi:uncharacterized Fe-S cluster protein YjdI
MNIKKKYTTEELTIIWEPAKCIHSAICFKNLPSVFDPRKRPWVTPEGGTTEQIIEQIKSCPSGALSYAMNHEIMEENPKSGESTKVEILENGPMLIHGELSVSDKIGKITQQSGVTAFCRCGNSGNKPYCDGSHARVGFLG